MAAFPSAFGGGLRGWNRGLVDESLRRLELYARQGAPMDGLTAAWLREVGAGPSLSFTPGSDGVWFVALARRNGFGALSPLGAQEELLVGDEEELPVLAPVRATWRQVTVLPAQDVWLVMEAALEEVAGVRLPSGVEFAGASEFEEVVPAGGLAETGSAVVRFAVLVTGPFGSPAVRGRLGVDASAWVPAEQLPAVTVSDVAALLLDGGAVVNGSGGG